MHNCMNITNTNQKNAVNTRALFASVSSLIAKDALTSSRDISYLSI